MSICVLYIIAQVHELPQSHCADNREGTLFSLLHIYYAYLTFVRFQHSVCHESLKLPIICMYICLAAELIFVDIYR